MNTEQNYVGGGNFATTPPQMDATASKTSPSPDDRQVRYVQTRLLKVVDQFHSDYGYEPVEVINDLLYRWLTTPSTDLSKEANQDQLHAVLSLVNFLSKLNYYAAGVDLTGKEANDEQ